MVEVVSLAEHPYIVEIFHATIGFSKRHHSLEFFCDDRLPGVRAQTRRGKIEQYGQVNFLDAGFDRVTETDIYGDGNSCASQCGCRPKP